MKFLYGIFVGSLFMTSFIVTKSLDAQSVNIIPFASGLQSPVCITHTDDSRLFVVDQVGYIFIIDSAGNVNPTPFLDIHTKVKFGGEQGLLGMAFHPQFSENGYFYVNYIGKSDSTHIVRFKVKSDNAKEADLQSEYKLLTLFQPYTNHNGGNLSFGPDGYLYIGLGDGGSSGDPGNRAQNPKEFLGKILRIDVNHGSPYAIPISNPFFSSTTTLKEVWAMGLRNPWRFSFDRKTGDLWIADVGQNAWEEVDFQPASSTGGENYGWRCYEGTHNYNIASCNPISDYTSPVYEYPHGEECSIIGGYVFRGFESSQYYGYYFFADYCSDRIWTLHKSGDSWVKEDFGQFSGNGFSTFGEDASGRLYIAGVSSGNIYRVVDIPTGLNRLDGMDVIEIMQNPFSDKITINTNQKNYPDTKFTLLDVNGTTLLQTTTREPMFEINPGPLPSGVYLLNIEMNGKRQVRKLVKIK